MCLASLDAIAEVRFTCSVPELESLVEEVSKKTISCPTLVRKNLDPHNVEITPSMIQRLQRTDVFITVGLGLEGPWLQKIMPHNLKIFSVGDLLDPQPAKNNHGHGNFDPHVLLSPKRIQKLYEILENYLKQQGCSVCDGKNLQIKMQKNISEWSKKLVSVSSNKYASYHGTFNYFLEDFGLISTLTIEELSGQAPTIQKLLATDKIMKEQNITRVLLEPTSPVGLSNKLQELNPNLVVLPLPIGITEKVPSLQELFDLYVHEMTHH